MAEPAPTSRCPLATSCGLFLRFSLKSSLDIWMQNYCEGPFQRCARYQASLERRPIPDLLLPNGKELKIGY
jgi:hypothetical protein